MKYYIITFSIYFLILFIILIFVRKPTKDEKKMFRETYNQRGSLSQLSKAERKARKAQVNARVKVLPLYQRVIYNVWFNSIIIAMFLPLIGSLIFRHYLISYLYIPESALAYLSGELAHIFFTGGALAANIAFLVVYSFVTNRGFIRKADKLYNKGSFQEYPERSNMFIASILFAISVPFMIISFNCYSYITPEKIVLKSPFSIKEDVYEYSDVDYIERKIYTNGKYEYIAHLSGGKKQTIFKDKAVEIALKDVLEENEIEIKINIVKRLI